MTEPNQNPIPDPWGTPEAIAAAKARERSARLSSGIATFQLWLWLAPVIAVLLCVGYMLIS